MAKPPLTGKDEIEEVSASDGKGKRDVHKCISYLQELSTSQKLQDILSPQKNYKEYNRVIAKVMSKGPTAMIPWIAPKVIIYFHMFCYHF